MLQQKVAVNFPHAICRSAHGIYGRAGLGRQCTSRHDRRGSISLYQTEGPLDGPRHTSLEAVGYPRWKAHGQKAE